MSLSTTYTPLSLHDALPIFDILDRKAREVAKVLESIHGAEDVQVKAPPGAPRLAVKLRFDRLMQFGFRPVEVLDAIQTRSEEHTSELQSHSDLVCRLLLEKK